MIYIHPTGKSLISGNICDTILFCISERSIETCLFRTALCADFIILMDTISEKNIFPVSIARPGFSSISVNFTISISNSLIHRPTVIQHIVFKPQVKNFPSLISVKYRTIINSHIRHTPVSLNIKLSFSSRATLCSYDNHTICSARAIQRCSRGILYYSHRLNIITVQGSQQAVTRISV